MIIYNNFKPAQVKTKRQAELKALGIQFIADDNGVCWYEAVQQMQEQKLKAVVVDDNGKVVGVNETPDQLFPNGHTVVAVARLPLGIAADGNWVFDGKEFKRDRAYAITFANERKRQELVENEMLLKVYEEQLSANPVDTALTEKVAKLKQHTTYLINLDTSTAPHIDWPATPVL